MSEPAELELAVARVIHESWTNVPYDPIKYPEDLATSRALLAAFDVTLRSTEPAPPKPLMAHDATLRDYFAAQVGAGNLWGQDPKWIAERAYLVADALLAARQETP